MRILIMLGLLLGTSCGLSAQTVSLEADLDRVERGQILELRLLISTDTLLTDVEVTVIPPRGFEVVDTIPHAVPARLVPGTHVYIFRTRYPLGTSPFVRGQTTGREVTFLANVHYVRSGEPRSELAAANVFYTTSLVVYLLSAFIGLMLGFFAKERLASSGDGSNPDPQRSESRRSQYVTIMLLGLLVLLYLAKGGLPATGWLDAFGLGVILGFAGDGALVERIRS